MPVRVLVVGGGHASLPLLSQASELSSADVTLLNDVPELWYSGMTPEYLGGVYTRTDVTVPLRPICEREGVAFVRGRATALDRDRREITTADGDVLGYDLLVIDVGGANPGTATGAIHTKPLHRISALAGEIESSEALGERYSVAIVGGGAAGTEVALNLSARSRSGFHERLRLTLIEPGDRLIPSAPPRVGRDAAALLRARGVTVRFGARADNVLDSGVRLSSGETLVSNAVLWATGTVGQPWLRESGLPVTENGFVCVERDLRVVGDPRVFVAGDAAMVRGLEDLSRVGVHAVKQGPILRENVRRVVRAAVQGSAPSLRRFRPYPVTPLLLSTGTDTAWGWAGGVALNSSALLRLKHAVDRRWIDRYRSPSAASYDGRWDAASAEDDGGASVR